MGKKDEAIRGFTQSLSQLNLFVIVNESYWGGGGHDRLLSENFDWGGHRCIFKSGGGSCEGNTFRKSSSQPPHLINNEWSLTYLLTNVILSYVGRNHTGGPAQSEQWVIGLIIFYMEFNC